MPHADPDRITLFIDPINKTLDHYEINTPLRAAAFLAQIAHESGSLNYVQEIASGASYNYRVDLGNTTNEAINAAHPFPPGRFYKGRGLIQITGFYNYKACGEALGVDLVHYPAMLEAPDLATKSAGWFWDKKHLNDYADVHDMFAITKRINGGTNGLKKRMAFYDRALHIL